LVLFHHVCININSCVLISRNCLDLAKALFQAVDQNHNGTLDFTDLMALTTMINKLSSQFGAGGIQE
jgi:hypothetical protein